MDTTTPVFPYIIFTIIMLGLPLIFNDHKKIPYIYLLLLTTIFFSKLKIDVVNGYLKLDQLIVVIFLIYFVSKYNLLIKGKKLSSDNKYIFIFIFLIALSSMFSQYSSTAFLKSVTLLPYILLSIVIPIFLNSKPKLVHTLEYIEKVGTLILILSISVYLLYPLGIDIGFVRFDMGARWLEGPIIIANIFGAIALYLFILYFHRFIITKNKKSLLFAIISIIAILFSYTRSVWFATILAINIIILLNSKLYRIWKIIFGITVILSILLIVFEYSNLMNEYGVKLNDMLGSENAASGRIITNSFIFEKSFENMLIGYGTDANIIKYGEKFYITSFFLTTFFNWGIIFTLIFFIFYFKIFIYLFRTRKRLTTKEDFFVVNSILTLMPVFIILNQVSTSHQISLFWIFLGIFISTKNLYN